MNGLELDKYITRQLFRYRDRPGWLNVYTITITPRGNNKSFEDTLYHLQEHARRSKSIKSIILTRETENTNHFHGFLLTSQASKHLRLYSKRNYDLKIEDYNNINADWCEYICKHRPTSLDVYTKKSQNFNLMELEAP